MRPFFVFLGVLALVGCGRKLDCSRLGRRIEPCRQEVYRALAGPEVLLLEELTAPGVLDESARRKILERWEPLRRAQAERLARRLESTCRKHGGRFLQADDVNACLGLEDCEAFASCLARALKREEGAAGKESPGRPRARKS